MAEPSKAGSTSGINAAAGSQAGLAIGSILRALASNDIEVRNAAVQSALKMRDRRGTEPLLFILQSKDAAARMEAARALAIVSPSNEGLQMMYSALQHNDPFVRAAVARALGKWGKRESIPTLIRALADHEADIRNVVGKALGRLGESRWPLWVESGVSERRAGHTREQQLCNLLVEDLRNSKLPAQRIHAAQTLPLIRHAQVVPELIRALGDENAEVRATAVESLGRSSDKHAMKKLIHMLDDENEAVRNATVAALDALDKLPD